MFSFDINQISQNCTNKSHSIDRKFREKGAINWYRDNKLIGGGWMGDTAEQKLFALAGV